MALERHLLSVARMPSHNPMIKQISEVKISSIFFACRQKGRWSGTIALFFTILFHSHPGGSMGRGR